MLLKTPNIDIKLYIQSMESFECRLFLIECKTVLIIASQKGYKEIVKEF